ncbi:MAG: hypothetical protein QNJ15_04220 [Erythrobacter sp.]|nr:hypothetical protein [Erythrobacter sp.]
MIDAGAVSATGGDVILQATGNITTTSVTSTENLAMGGAIDIDSTGGGTLDLGSLTGDGQASLDTTGTLTPGVINIGGALVIGATNDPTTLNLNDSITAGSFAYTTANPFVAQDITTTDGDLNINAASITTGALDAENGGGVILTSPGNITTTSINSNEPGATNGFIDVESTGGGTLDLGALSSDGDIALDTSGLITTSTITTLNDLTIGGTTTATTVTFTGNVDADIIDINATGTVTGLAIDATDGNLDINAGVIDAGAVSATGGDVILQATGNITTTSITSNEDAFNMGGAIDVDSTGGSVDLGTVNADGLVDVDAFVNITTGSVTTVAGDINLNAGGAINTGALDANDGGGAILTAVGDITTASITSNEPGATNGFIDVESTGGGTLDLGSLSSDGDIALDTTGALTTDTISSLGDLTIGGTAIPATVTFTGNVSADMVDIDATGAVTSVDIAATDGDLNILAGSILGGHLSAAGGDVILSASGAITTTSITADRVMGNGGSVDVDSTGGGNLNLGDITADSNVTLDTLGILQYNDLNAPGGLIDIGSTAMPSMIIVTGSQIALEFIINSLTDVMVNDLTATAGVIDIDAPNITAGHLSATGGDVTLTAPGNITTTSITSIESGGFGGAIDVDSTAGGILDLGDLTSDGLITLDTLGNLTLGTVNAGGALDIGTLNMPALLNLTGNITAASFSFTTLDPFVSLDITTTAGNIDIDAASITTGALDANGGGGVILTSPGNITTASITANEPGVLNGFIDVDSTGGGTLDLGALASDGNIALDTSGTVTTSTITTLGNLTIGGMTTPTTVTFTGNVDADVIDINATGTVSGLAIDATDGNLDINAGVIDAGDVSATGGDVILQATGNITTTSITSNEDAFLMGGAIDVDSTGGSVDLGTIASDGLTDVDAAINITTGAVTTVAGDINLNALNNIDTGALDANGGGGVILTAAGNITTASITANEPGVLNGFIDVDSGGAGTLDLGALSSDGNITLDTGGALTTDTITSLGDLTIGGAAIPSTVTFTGNVSADNVDIDANGLVTALDIEATDGILDVFADAIDAGALSATGGDVILQAVADITTASITSNEDFLLVGGSVTVDSLGGNLDLGTINADGAVSATALAGDILTGDVTTQAGTIFMDGIFVTTLNLDANGGGGVRLFGQADVTTGDIAANEPGVLNGFIEIASTFGGELDLGNLTTDGDVTLDSLGPMTIASINALGDLTLGAGIDPSGVTFTGNVSADAITIISNSFVVGQDIDATDGDLTITAGTSIDADALTSTGGDSILSAGGNITTASITSNEDAFLMGGAIDVDSIAGGALDLGDLMSDGGIALDTSGSVEAAAVNAGGTFDVGSTSTPLTISLTDTVTAASVNLLATASVSTQDITATAGVIDVEANQQVLGALSATGNIVLDGGTSITAASITADSDTSGAGDVLIGTTTAPVTLTFAGATSGAGVSATGGSATFADVTSTAGAVSLTATAGALSAAIVNATGANATLSASGNVTTASITTTGGSIDVDSTGGGALDLGDLTSDAGIALDTSGTLMAGAVNATGALTVGQTAMPSSTTFAGNVVAGSMDIDGAAAGTLTAQDLTANAGDIDIDVGSIAAANVGATGNIALDGAGTIALTNATADSDTSGAGDLSIGSTTIPSQLTVTGTASGVNTSLHAGTLNVTTATATGGDLVLSGDTLTVGTAQATNNVIADATTSITADTITADSDMSGMGDVEVGLMMAPGQLTITNSVTGAAVTLQADNHTIVNGISNNGDITVRGVVIDISDVNSTGGDVMLEATGDITTTSITATAAGMVGGNIDVDSTAGGALDLGDVAADSGITLDTTGSLAAGMITAVGAVEVGGTAAPSSVNLSGNVMASSIDVLATGDVDAQDLTATAGDIDLDGSSLTALDVTASGSVSADAAGPIAFAGVTADSDGDLAGDVSIGTATTPTVLDVSGATSGANVTLQAADSLSTGTVGAVAGDAIVRSGGSATTDDVVASGNVDLVAGTTLTSQNVTAMGGNVTLSATDISSQTVEASGDVMADGAGTIALASALADSDMNGTGDLSVGTIDAPSDLTIAGAASGVNSILTSSGDITVGTIEATGGNVVVGAGDSVTVNAISSAAAGMSGGAIDVDSTGGGTLSLGDLAADADIAIDTTGDVSANEVSASGALAVGGVAVPSSVTFTGNVAAGSVGIETVGNLVAQDVTATAGAIVANAADVSAGALAATDAVTLDATGAINLASAVADSDLNGSGDLSVGTTTAPTDLAVAGAVSGANVSIVSAGPTSVGTVTTTGGDTSIISDGDTDVASVDTSELAIQSSGALSVGAIEASGTAVLESADIDLLAAVDVDGASLTLRSAPGVGIGIGDGAGDYLLSDAELALIDTGTLVIDAVDQQIEIGGVSFTDQAGANEVIVATSGAGSQIRILGDISGNGNARTFRFGGDAAMGTMLAERITMDIEAATIDFGDATFDLRAEDIVFGNQELIDAVAGRDSGDLALNIVGDANSILFNPLLAGGIGGARVADPVYLRAGSISVSYGNSTLFQNTAPPVEGGTIFTGIELGEFGNTGILNLDATDDTNTFAFFGKINGLEGTAAALAGSNVILLGNDVRLPDSRVNGCVIGSGADCVTTIVGTTTISIPREVVELLTADDGLLVPFDPLVGTNNEGLFSDAATQPDEDCERDENGACVGT